MKAFWDKFAVSARSLRRNPSFGIPVVVLLALAIGATTALYSFTDAMLLRPLPFRAPQELVLVGSAEQEEPTGVRLSAPDFHDLRRYATTLEDVAALAPWGLTLTGVEDPHQLPTLMVTPNLFALLGVNAHLGRTFAPDDVHGGNPVVVVSHAFWRRQLGADPSAVGRSLELDGLSYTLIGVLPPDMTFPTPDVDLWIPATFEGGEQDRASRSWLQAIGRRADGQSNAAVRHELEALSTRLAAAYPQTNAGWFLTMEPLAEIQARTARPSLLALQGTVVLVLLIACANVAGLFLVRTESRGPELAIRSALGARPSDHLGLVLRESLLLSALGGILGVGLAYLGVQWILALVPPEQSSSFESIAGQAFPRLEQVGVNYRVLLFAAILSVGLACLIALLSFYRARKVDLLGGLGAEIRSSTGAQRRHARKRFLVVSEFTLALTLLVGAGLFLESFVSLLRVDPGFSAERVLTMEISVGRFRDPAERAEVIRQLLASVEQLPGIEEVGFSTTLPFSQVDWTVRFSVVGEPGAGGQTLRSAIYHAASPGYFRALDIPLRYGRILRSRDDLEHPKVVVVNETLARQLGGAPSVEGRKIVFDGEKESYAIVGVVGDTRQKGLDIAVAPEIYASFAQRPPRFMKLVVRTDGSPAGFMEPVKRRLRAVLPGLPVRNAVPLTQLVGNTTADGRFNAALAGLFAGIALILSGTGMYSVISYFVVGRRRELGIRMALGATRSDILLVVMREGTFLAMVGVGAGVVAAAIFAAVLRSSLHGIPALELGTVALPVFVLMAVSLVASLLPARRAARLDPGSTLHEA